MRIFSLVKTQSETLQVRPLHDYHRTDFLLLHDWKIFQSVEVSKIHAGERIGVQSCSGLALVLHAGIKTKG